MMITCGEEVDFRKQVSITECSHGHAAERTFSGRDSSDPNYNHRGSVGGGSRRQRRGRFLMSQPDFTPSDIIYFFPPSRHPTLGTWDVGLGTCDIDSGAWDLESGTPCLRLVEIDE